MSAGFEEWWESLGELVPHKQDEFARMVWEAALRRAAEKWIADNGFDKHGVAEFLQREIAGG